MRIIRDICKKLSLLLLLSLFNVICIIITERLKAETFLKVEQRKAKYQEKKEWLTEKIKNYFVMMRTFLLIIRISTNKTMTF